MEGSDDDDVDDGIFAIWYLGNLFVGAPIFVGILKIWFGAPLWVVLLFSMSVAIITAWIAGFIVNERHRPAVSDTPPSPNPSDP